MGNSGFNSKNASNKANSNAISDVVGKNASNKSSENGLAKNKSNGNGNSIVNVSKGSTK